MKEQRTERERFLDVLELLFVEIVLRDTVLMTYAKNHLPCAQWEQDLADTRALLASDARRRFAGMRERIAQQPDPELLVKELLRALPKHGSVQ